MGIVLEEEQENSNDVDEDHIISQDIEAGTKVKSGDTVKVVVSKGTKKTTVPTVIDMDEGTAKATLSNANLNVNVSYESHEDKDNGKVISQSISQGKEVAEGTTIDIVVNKFEKKTKTVKLEVTVPKSSNSSTGSDNENETEEVESVTVSVLVNGKSQVSEKTAKPGETIDCGKITGSGEQKVTVQINGKTTLTKNFDIDDYADNGTVYVE